MNAPHSKQLRDQVIERYLAGDRLRDIESETGVTRPTIYLWLKSEGHNPSRRQKTAPLHVRQMLEQLAEANQRIGHLEAELEAARAEIVRLKAKR